MGFFGALWDVLYDAPTQTAPVKEVRHSFVNAKLIPEDYTVIDLETSGLRPKTSEILEIGAIKYRSGTEVDRYHTFIRPVGCIPKQASDVNGITWRKVRDSPYLEDIRDAFFSFIGDDILVGHNISFDVRFIQTRFETWLKNPCFDTLEWSRMAFPDLDNHKLHSLRRLFQLGGDPHTALGDCVATHGLLVRISESDIAQKRHHKHVLEYQEYQRRMEAYQQRLKEYEAYLVAVREKKQAAKKNSPSQAELKRISKDMTGTVSDYLSAALSLLDQLGLSTADIKIYRNTLIYQWRPLFAVKADGVLKYIVIPVPMEKIVCDYVCTPSSMAEGDDSTRIYIHSPADLETISQYMVEAYNYVQTNEVSAKPPVCDAYF